MWFKKVITPGRHNGARGAKRLEKRPRAINHGLNRPSMNGVGRSTRLTNYGGPLFYTPGFSKRCEARLRNTGERIFIRNIEVEIRGTGRRKIRRGSWRISL